MNFTEIKMCSGADFDLESGMKTDLNWIYTENLWYIWVLDVLAFTLSLHL